MFAILLVASVILPSVLGCCFPSTMSAVTYTAGSREIISQVVDYDKMKVISRPQNDPVVEFRLHDVANKKVYIKNKDGSCTFTDDALMFAKCVPEAAKFVNGYLGGMKNGLETDTYIMAANGASTVITVAKADCVPVDAMTTVNGMTTTRFFVNVTTPVDTSDVMQDLTTCVEEI